MNQPGKKLDHAGIAAGFWKKFQCTGLAGRFHGRFSSHLTVFKEGKSTCIFPLQKIGIVFVQANFRRHEN